MNRRSFLEALAATAAGLVLPEPARGNRVYSFMPGLWAPPECTISVVYSLDGGTTFTGQGPLPEHLARGELKLGDWITVDRDGILIPARVASPLFGRVVYIGGACR